MAATSASGETDLWARAIAVALATIRWVIGALLEEHGTAAIAGDVVTDNRVVDGTVETKVVRPLEVMCTELGAWAVAVNMATIRWVVGALPQEGVRATVPRDIVTRLGTDRRASITSVFRVTVFAH